MITKKIIHLMSGGLDSTACLRMLLDEGHDVHCLLVDYEQPHVKELIYAERTCEQWGVKKTIRRIGKLGGLTDANWIVPVRNLTLVSLAANLAVQAGAGTVTIGCNRDDESAFPDCRLAFIQLCNTLLTTIETDVEVCAPFLDWPKWKIASLAKDMGIGSDHVWACYRGGEVPCGNCPACLKLEAAFS